MRWCHSLLEARLAAPISSLLEKPTAKCSAFAKATSQSECAVCPPCCTPAALPHSRRRSGCPGRWCSIRLYNDIGPDVDVLSGGIGCGPREIGYMFGQYKRLSNSFGAGAFTGKGEGWGGSRMQLEAPGYGVVYFAEHMLEAKGDVIEGGWVDRWEGLRSSFVNIVCVARTVSRTHGGSGMCSGKRVCVSGAGRVGIHAVEKLITLGAKPVTMSDSAGCVYEPEGFTSEQLEAIKTIKFNGGKLEEYANQSDTARCVFH